MYVYIYNIWYLLKYQKFMYPWGATVAFTSGFWGLISEASPATCPGQGARMISTKMGETRINIGCNIGLWKRLIFSYCTKICLDRVGHDYDSHDFDWRIWPIPALNHRSDFNLGGGVWGTFSRGFLWLRWSCLAGQDSPSGSPPSEKKNMQNHLHFEPPFPLSCLPFVLIQPQRVINVVAVMECLRDFAGPAQVLSFCKFSVVVSVHTCFSSEDSHVLSYFSTCWQLVSVRLWKLRYVHTLYIYMI